MSAADSKTVVLVFSRAPEPGGVKTRLIPTLGASGAARLQGAMTNHAVSVARRASLGDIELWCAPSSEHPGFAGFADIDRLTLHTQHGDTLGERLQYGHDLAFSRYGAILIMGTDCPALTEGLLQRASMDLNEADAVVIPAEDGGYVMLGLSQACCAVFRDIDWGTERVFGQTVQRLKGCGMRQLVYPPLWDVDRPQDLERLRAYMPQLVFAS